MDDISERARNWRAPLESGEWPSQLVISYMSAEDRLELKGILEQTLPEKEYGQGLGVFKSAIAPRDALDPGQFSASRCYSDLLDFLRPPQPSASDLIEQAEYAAIDVLRMEGVTYQGWQETFLYFNPEKGHAFEQRWTQLPNTIGRALFERSNQYLWEDSSRNPHRRREKWYQWIGRYPWRACLPLSSIFIGNKITPLTYGWLACKALHNINILGNWEESPGSKHLCRDNVLLELGGLAERLSALPYDDDALRGIKTLQSAKKGAQAISGRPRSAGKKHPGSVTKEMSSRISQGHSISQAAALTHKAGFGSSADANRQMWYRRKKTVT